MFYMYNFKNHQLHYFILSEPIVIINYYFK